MSDYRQVTRADVARQAGVSETIVSYVINNNRYVDQKKRERVLEAIKELHYRPNSIARALKGKSSNHLIFIADQIANEHFSQLIVEMDRYAYSQGYLISLCANRNSEEFVSQIISRQFDGIVMSSISLPEKYINQFIAAQIPVVLLLNRDYNSVKGAGMIDTGLYSGAKECVRYLAGKGRRNILYLDRFSSSGNFSTLDDLRLRGFLEQMEESGMDATDRSIITGCCNEQQVVEKTRQRILEEPSINAIFGRNDRLACLGIEAAKSLGKRVPEDIAIIGFDNSSLSQYTSPRLTTMQMQRREIGKAAIEMLHSMIGGNDPTRVTFTTQLIERESTWCNGQKPDTQLTE
ncbi:MAG: LacI family DNA-binding transcriptional regulator [Angelakisella sp.]